MARNLFKIFIFKLFICSVLSNYVYQYPANQFHQPTYPVPLRYSEPPTPKYKTYPSYQPYQAQANYYSKPVEPVSKPCPKPPPIPEPSAPLVPPVEEKRSTGFDTNVLNNLAIALQLLIVSNIISNPPSESALPLLSDSLTTTPCSEKTTLKSLLEANSWDSRVTPPNSKFLGDADVTIGNYGSLPKPFSRPGGFMSPYEAMNSFSDLSKYNSKKDFQSPYAAILTFDNNKDLFSMGDLF